MIYENIEFHNVEELYSVPGQSGLRLQRVPETVRMTLNKIAQLRMLQPESCEIRFVSDGPCRITLSSESQTHVTVFQGLLDTGQRFIIGKQPKTIEIGTPEHQSLWNLDSVYWQNMSFSPRVCRIIFGGPQRATVYFHDVDGNLRLPEADELPSLRYLTYGTSITQGFCSSEPHLCYVAQAARHIGADLINLGSAASAYCEGSLADYIAARTDWHITTLALSVNMQMRGFPLEEFYERVSYMVNMVAALNTDRPVVCITIFPHFRDFGIEPPDKVYKGKSEEYRQALRDAVADCPYPNVHLLEGTELLRNISGLTVDLIHPGDNGMIEIGRNLAEKLKHILSKKFSSCVE